MALKFFKKGNIWIYDNKEVNQSEENTIPQGYWRRRVDGTKISIFAYNTKQHFIFREVEVTKIEKDVNGNRYSGILDFIVSTESFFTDTASMTRRDYANRSSMNSVFGESVIGVRRVDIAAQFQYGYPINASIQDIVGSGDISFSESMLCVSTGIDNNGKARISNKKALRYIPGHEAYIFFTCLFTEGVNNSIQRAGLFDDQNGYFIGYEGVDFCVTRRRNGIDYKTIIDINNVFTNNSFNPTYGNIYKISYGYLGFANINFEVLSPEGYWIVIHTIKYAGNNIQTHILNTNLQPRLEVENIGNTTDIVAKTGSFCAGVIDGGGGDPQIRPFSISLLEQAVTAGTDTVLMLRSKTFFNGLINYIESLMSLLSISNDLNRSIIVSLILNPTIINTPTWSDKDTLNSIIEYTLDADTSGGEQIFAFTMSSGDNFYNNIEKDKIELLPEDVLAVRILSPLGTTGNITMSMRWKELF